MRRRVVTVSSWLAGLCGIAAIVYFVRPGDFGSALGLVGIHGGSLWLLLTLIARLFLVETTVLPLEALGFSFGRMNAFWLGWVRSFSNQILPLSGLAVYAHEIRRRTDIPWSGMAALSTPQFFLAATSLGVVGIFAAILGANVIGQAAAPTAIVFALIGSGSFIVAYKVSWLLGLLPDSLSTKAVDAARAFATIAEKPNLLTKLIACHLGALLLRGGRVLVLFYAIGQAMEWREALLLLAIIESAAVFQLTPGGLGLREGAIVGAAVLLGIPAETGATVALIDRLFVIGTTSLLLAPAIAFVRKDKCVGGA